MVASVSGYLRMRLFHEDPEIVEMENFFIGKIDGGWLPKTIALEHNEPRFCVQRVVSVSGVRWISEVT